MFKSPASPIFEIVMCRETSKPFQHQVKAQRSSLFASQTVAQMWCAKPQTAQHSGCKEPAQLQKVDPSFTAYIDKWYVESRNERYHLADGWMDGVHAR